MAAQKTVFKVWFGYVDTPLTSAYFRAASIEWAILTARQWAEEHPDLLFAELANHINKVEVVCQLEN